MTPIAALLARAIEVHRAGDAAEAGRLYGEILERAPGHADALHLKGVLSFQGGDCAAAAELIEAAIRQAPAVADYHSNLGEVRRVVGDAERAKAHLEQALAIDPRHADAHVNLGLVWQKLGRAQEAEAAFRAALTIAGDHVKARNNLGVLLREQGRVDEAIAEFKVALGHGPNAADTLSNLGNALWSKGRADQAKAFFCGALASNPTHAGATIGLATVLKAGGEAGQASALFHRAAAANGDHAGAHYNLGVDLFERGDIDGAIESYRRSLACDDANVGAVKNLGVALLLAGEFAAGFDGWEARWREPGVWRREVAQPAWSGEPLAGKTIFVWGEQGVGDEIMFASVLADLIANGAQPVVESDARLVGLFGRAFPAARFVARGPIERIPEEVGRFDVHCSLGSLCRWLRQDRDRFRPKAYLEADPDRVGRIASRYRNQFDAPRIGVAWRSHATGGRRENDAFKLAKSSRLGDWEAVLGQQGATFVCLQYGDVDADIAAAETRFGCSIYQDPEIDQGRDLEALAAQISAIDLVITTSNTTAHLAGALGKEVWTMVAHVPDWRWQRQRADTLWYPRMRLFRQRVPGDWCEVVARVGAALAKRLSE